MRIKAMILFCLSVYLFTGDVFAADPQTAAEWLVWARAEAAKEKAAIEADARLKEIFTSSPVATTGSAGMPTSTGVHDAFMAGEGLPLIEKFLNGTLTGDELKYRSVIEAHVLNQAVKVLPKKKQKGTALTPVEEQCLKFAETAKTKGAETLKQAYKTGVLTRAAMDDIRTYMLLTSEIDWVGSKFMPFKLGLTPRMYGPEPGDTAVDFCLQRGSSIWERPDFKPQPVVDPLRALTWSITEEALMVMNGHETGPNGTLVPKKELLVPPAEAKGSDYVQLSSFRGKKPVLLIIGDATDTYCCHGYISSKLEDIYRVFNDKVEIFWINDTVHDYRMPFMNYFAASSSQVRGGSMHALNLETRATTAQSFYMAYPYMSIPCLFDNMAQTVRNSFSDLGGEAEFWLIDVNGVIAYRTKGPNECAGWEWKKLDVTHLIRTDCLTRALLALLQNNGVYDPAWPKKCAHIKITDPSWEKIPANKPGSMWLAGTVAAVNVESGIVTVERDPVNRADYPGLKWWQQAPRANGISGGIITMADVLEQWAQPDAPRTLQLKVSESTYLALNGTACSLADFKSGDRIGVQIPAAEARNAEVSAGVLRAFRF